MAGYIKLYREIQEHWTWQDKPFSKGQAWIDLLMMANHDSNKVILGNEIIHVERGCLVTSEVKLAERWGWSRCKVRAFLDLLKQDEMIVKKSDSKKTCLKIVNYSVWQNSETGKKQRKDSVQTAFRQRSDTNKNVKNNKNEKKNIYIGLSEKLQKTLQDFIEHRKKLRKPMTDKAIELLIGKLNRLASTDEEKIQLIEHAIERGWLSVFPMKEDKPAVQIKKPPQALNFEERQQYSDEIYKKLSKLSLGG